MPEATLPIGPETRRERTESARLDNFVDGAFAFAVTLLIISAGMPRAHVAVTGPFSTLPAVAPPRHLVGCSGASCSLPGLIVPAAHFHRKHLEHRLPP